MTLEQDVRTGLRRAVPTRLPFLGATVTAVVVLRLLLAFRPAAPDEGGFLVVASQWHVGGTSLYGDYWVDRPPLLIGIFRLADLAGGLVALRVVGAIAAAATVVLVAGTARRAFGEVEGRWAAVAAAALLVSPLFGSGPVDGELLAIPFIALGLRLSVEAVLAIDPLTARAAAFGTGATAMLALLVKQNMADGVVFAVVCWLVAWRTRRVSGRTCADLLALAVTGAGVGYAVVMLWAMAHGTSPLGVYEATYPFRLHAGHEIAAGASNVTGMRLGRLGLSAVLSGAAFVLVAFAALAVRRTPSAPVVWGIVASATFASVSILAGGSYWLHYLVEAAPVVALAAGALAAVRRRAAVLATRALAAVMVASALVTLDAVVANPEPAPGAVVGRALADSARPGDTVLSAFGDADILQSTGMSAPYPYLWSLPSRTLDPDLALLRGILAGPAAPTWIVVRGPHTLDRLSQHGAADLVTARYRFVEQVCARSVYLLRGISRPALHPQGRCGGLVLP